MKKKLTKAQVKRRLKAKVAWIKRIGLKNHNFSIISNNCWGGSVYDEYALPYLSPTIGMWFLSDDYIRFISNLEFYLKAELKQISYDECHMRELLVARKERGRYDFPLGSMIIGRLVDVDIVFLHYKTFEDAYHKWNRRRTRINPDCLVVKFNDQNDFHIENYDVFANLPFRHKLFFTARKDIKGDGIIYISNMDEEGSVKDDTVLKNLPMNIKKYLNNMLCDNNHTKK